MGSPRHVVLSTVAAAAVAVATVGCADDGNAGNVNIVGNLDLTTTASPPSTTADIGVERFEVEIANFQFGPVDAVVPAGTEVVWLNNDTDVHSIISTGDLFASGDTFEPGESYTATFTEPGVYAYICGVHPFMEGTITVQ